MTSKIDIIPAIEVTLWGFLIVLVILLTFKVIDCLEQLKEETYDDR